MEARVMREAGPLAAAPGVPLEDRPRCPPPWLSRLQKTGRWPSCIGARLREHALQMRQLALQDVERGRRLEVEETLGSTLRRAAEVGLAMPTIAMCDELLSGL
jgi:ketopantoate reductase